MVKEQLTFISLEELKQILHYEIIYCNKYIYYTWSKIDMEFTYHNNFLSTFKLFGKINPEQYTLR